MKNHFVELLEILETGRAATLAISALKAKVLAAKEPKAEATAKPAKKAKARRAPKIVAGPAA
jgi:hypothetical protein